MAAVTRAETVLAVTAVSGELSPLALARLIPAERYRYNVVEALQQQKLLRPYTKDKLKGYRLTAQGKRSLLRANPERYQALFTGAAQTNAYVSEPSKRLRLHRVAETVAMMTLCEVPVWRDALPPLFAPGAVAPREPFVGWYASRTVQQLGDRAIKIKSARMTGVLLAPRRYYLCYNTADGLMRWNAASEQRAALLLREYLTRELALPAYRDRRADALLIGNGMDLAEALLTSRGGAQHRYFALDATFDHLHYLPNDPQGDALLRLLCADAAPRLNAELSRSFGPKTLGGNFAYDATTDTGQPVLFCWDMDLVRLRSFLTALALHGRTGVVVAFAFQAPALERLFGTLAVIRPLSLEHTTRWLL